MKIKDLTPGDIVYGLGQTVTSVFVGSMEHPLYPRLRLVIWHLSEPISAKHGHWSHDALDPEQEVGPVFHWKDGDQVRRDTLRRVLGE